MKEDNKVFKDYHGQDGYTPQKGVDYGTEEDKEIIVAEVQEEFDGEFEKKVDKEKGKGLSTNDFTNILKEKLENLENYDDTEIRDILNSSLKEVNYTASNGILTFTTNDGTKVEIDLPLELLVESGKYDEPNKQIVLTLANGNVINIPVSDLLDDFYGKNETYNKEEVDNIIAEKQALIEKLESENKSQQEEIDMLTADYKENTIEGETVVISDGLTNSKASSIINGNSKQETTEGYNLFDFINSVFSINNAGTFEKDISNNLIKVIPSSATQWEGIYSYLEKEFEIGNIIISFLAKADKNTTVRVGTSGAYTSYSNIEVGTDYKQFYLSFNLSASGIIAINFYNWNTTEVVPFYIKDIIVMTGTEQKPYEPYTGGQASPNTEYKQDIEVIDGVNILNPANVNSSSTLPNTLIEKTRYRLTSSTLGNALIFKDLGLKKGTYTVSIQIISGDYQGGPLVARNSENANTGEVAIKGTTNKISLVVKDNDINSLVLWQVPAGTDIVYDIQIEKGEKSSAFLPYGHIGLVQRGKNLYKIKKSFSRTENGITCELEDGIITLNGEATAGTTLILSDVNELYSLKAGIYTISAKVLSGSYTGIVGKYVKDYKTNKELIDGDLIDKTVKKTLNEDNSNLLSTIFIASGAVLNNYQILIQLEESLTATDYEPYIEPIVHEIDLDGNKLAKVGEIADLLNIGVNGRVSLTKNTGRDTLTENDIWSAPIFDNDNAIARFNVNKFIDKIKPSTLLLCNRFIGTTNYDFLFVDSYVVNPSSGSISFCNTDITTLEDWKTWIAENNLDVLYELLNPQTITLPSIEPITLFEGTNIFELVTNLDTTLSVTYKVSNKSRLEALENAILSLGGNV